MGNQNLTIKTGWIPVKYFSVKTNQFKNVKISTLIFVGVGPYFNVKYAYLFPICNGYHRNFQWT